MQRPVSGPSGQSEKRRLFTNKTESDIIIRMMPEVFFDAGIIRT